MRKFYFSLFLFLCAITNLHAQNVNVTATSGTTNGSYPTLKDAFDAINAGTHQGTLTVDVALSTVETATARLNASGTGGANYSSVLLKPTAAATISGSIAGPLVDLYGADNVTIDGRIGAAGTTRSLTIQNLSTVNSANTSTIRFIEDAQSDVLNYLNLEGSAPLGASGAGAVIYFDTTTLSQGNRNIIVSNNDIGPAAGATPALAIYSSGFSSAIPNSAVTISNNSIHDYFSPSGLSSAIALDPFTTGWTITGNSFYQTISRTSTASAQHFIINIYNGSGYVITNNYIGGSAAVAAGAPYTITGAVDVNNYIVSIYLRVGTAGTTNVDGNTITNLNLSSTPSANALFFNAMRVTTGNVNIGVNSGNIIGAATGTGAIALTAVGANANFSEGILTANTGTLDIRNNTFGSITHTGGTGVASLRVIETNATPSSLNIQNNFIGGTTANSIQLNNTAAAFLGIFNLQNAVGTTVINSNTIRNITNNGTGTNSASIVAIQNQVAASNTNAVNSITNNIITALSSPATTATAGSVSGIIITQSASLTAATSDGNINNNQISNLYSGSTSASALVRGIANINAFPNFLNINGNTIHTLSSASLSTISTVTGATTAITQGNTFATATGPCSISGNIIYNLENTASSAATQVIGIGLSHGSAGATVAQNRVYDLRNPNTTAAGLVSGIVLRGISSAGAFTVSNNMVSLSPANVQAYGIHNNLLAGQINAYHNSVYVNGAASGTNASAAFFRNAVATPVNLRNNILYNVRTAGGSHYAVSNTNAAPATGWVSDYNNLYTANAATTALWGAANNDLATYKANSGDVNSKSFTVSFTNTPTADLHLTGASVGDVNLKGTNTTGISVDFDGQARGNTPYLGADEVITNYLPITMEFFSGRKQAAGNLLSWKASCTSPSITFEIERSADGRRFSNIGRIDATQARCESPFDFTDVSPASGINYYRLKMTETDGALKYSAVIAILNKTTGFELVGLYPTLIKTDGTVSVTSAGKTSLQLAVVDLSGRLLMQKALAITEGSTLHKVSFSNLANGVYHLTASTPEGYTKTIRFVKQ